MYLHYFPPIRGLLHSMTQIVLADLMFATFFYLHLGYGYTRLGQQLLMWYERKTRYEGNSHCSWLWWHCKYCKIIRQKLIHVTDSFWNCRWGIKYGIVHNWYTLLSRLNSLCTWIVLEVYYKAMHSQSWIQDSSNAEFWFFAQIKV